jgi:catechol 2,3-dioxygenase-like lactoylglutathione lyase family enzyme
MFGILVPYDEKDATVGNGTMVGFAVGSREKVRQFYEAALASGGTCDGPPGMREPSDMQPYFAYVRDPDGNKICAYHLGPE